MEIPNSLVGSLAYQVSTQSLPEAILVAKMQSRIASRIGRIHIGSISKRKLDDAFAVVLTTDG